MFASVDTAGTARNLVVYLIGVAMAVGGALGLAGAIELPVTLSALLLLAGLGMVVLVHEYLDGPF